MLKMARGYSLFINWFNGLAALICGSWMMLSAMVDLPLSWNDWMPLWLYDPMPLHDVFFTSHFWPGLALLLVNGVGNMVAAACHLRKDYVRWQRYCLAAGVLLVAWTSFEMAFIPNGASVLYMILGILQVLAALKIRRGNGK